MGLHIRRAPSRKLQLAVTLFAAFAIVSQPLAATLQGITASAMSTTPDTSKVTFKNSPKYVRENNTGDISAQLITYSATTSVNFYVDGNMDASVPGVRHGVTKMGYDEWRLKTPLAAGEHSVTAQVKIGGDWYTASGEATVYSLDSPSARYILPTDQNHVFRPGDNPLRLKIDDEFGQFDRTAFSLYYYDAASNKFGNHIGSFAINRSECDGREAGRYLLCDINKTIDWTDLADGSYAVKLTTHTKAGNGIRTTMSEHWSHPFTIDSVQPAITDFTIEGSTTVGGSLEVAAAATDNDKVESIHFYATKPRSDGVCTGNEAKLAEFRAFLPDAADSQYRATLNLTGFDSGTYCVMAVARDDAMSNSGIAKLVFNVDHTGPTVTIQVTGSANPTASTDAILLAGHIEGDFNSLEMTLNDGSTSTTFPLSYDGSGNWTYALPKEQVVQGTYDFSVVAADAYGNKSVPATLSVVVNPYVPGRGSAVPARLVSPVAPTLDLVIPGAFATGGVLPLPATQQPEAGPDTEVLGAETGKDVLTESSDLPAVAATESGWKIFGVAWYWLVLVLAILASGAWWTAANLRRRKAAEPA